jgi:hypothetical protein
MALLRQGANALVPADLTGASAAALAARAGQRAAADLLYRTAAQLSRAASKAAWRAHDVYRQVRSELVVANRVELPRELVDHMLDYCATADCWFADSPAALAERQARAAAAAVAEERAGGAGGAAEGGARESKGPV